MAKEAAFKEQQTKQQKSIAHCLNFDLHLKRLFNFNKTHAKLIVKLKLIQRRVKGFIYRKKYARYKAKVCLG